MLYCSSNVHLGILGWEKEASDDKNGPKTARPR